MPGAEPPAARLDQAAFTEAVLALVDRVPPGCVVTYGQVADLLGQGGPRGVAQFEDISENEALVRLQAMG